MNALNYKGYSARVEFSDEDEALIGHIAGIHDVIGFHGESVEEIKSSFHEAVDDYLKTCQKLNRPPQKPFFWKIYRANEKRTSCKGSRQG